MQENQKKCIEIAERIYDLDIEVYRCVGSSLGRTFTEDRNACVDNLANLMNLKLQGHLLRSELALIANMARTIKNKQDRSRVMAEYDQILKEVAELPASFGKIDIIDQNRARLNTANLHQKFSKDDHLIICIGRTQGSAGNDIGFALADALHINYYDVEIFNEVLRRMEGENEGFRDHESMEDGVIQNKYQKGFGESKGIRQRMREFSKYHGLPKRDAVFFAQSQLLCKMAKQEDFIVMGRCADAILTNNRIPHVSIFITAPFQQRLHRLMEVNDIDIKAARKLLKRLDRQHASYYNFYTGHKWGEAGNYDICFNSASYGIEESVEIIERMLDKHLDKK